MAALIRTMIVLSLLSAAESYAAMRCGNYLVAVGDTKLDVMMRCGPPTLAEPTAVVGAERYRLDGRVGIASTVELWHYNCGSGLLNKSLVFEGGVLRAVVAQRTRGMGSPRCQ